MKRANSEPPNLLDGPLSPENQAWLWTQQAKVPGRRVQVEAIARSNGYERDDHGRFIPGIQVEVVTEE